MSYVSKRFRSFRKPIRRKGAFVVGDRGPEVIITVGPNKNGEAAAREVIDLINAYKGRGGVV